MKKELATILREKYPTLSQDYGGDMTKTCMAWGFECGDGWYNILDELFEKLTDSKYSGTFKSVDREFRNRFCEKLNWSIHTILHNINIHISHKMPVYKITEFLKKHIFQKITNIEDYQFDGIVLAQVKEKFGTLRVYINGCPNEIFEEVHQHIGVAEIKSGETCETCGKPGKRIGDGWVRTICEKCSNKES